MSSSRRLSVGRSPLVRKQSQITSFFTPGKSPNPIPNPNPSPLQSEHSEPKKPKVVIPPSPAVPSLKTPPSESKNGVSGNVVGRRIKVFWPLDEAWYEGRVVGLDGVKCLIRYDDGEEENLELSNEKFEFLDEVEESTIKRRKRSLRRMSDVGSCREVENVKLGSEKFEFLQEEEEGSTTRRRRRLRKMLDVVSRRGELEDEEDNGCDDDDSVEDEDWGKGLGKKDLIDDDSEEVELEDEDEEQEIFLSSRSGRGNGSSMSKRRKKIDVGKLDCAKKVKFDADGEKSPPKVSLVKTGSFLSRAVADKERNGALENNDVHMSSEAVDRFGKREAEKFGFLGKGRKDAKGRCPGHENYDPNTLYLPHQFLKSLTDVQKQWWEFKSKHMDKVLFFKMGKFYELFEMDAHVGAKELDLQYMKGEQPHCGFPEKTFSMNLEKMVQKGYRVLVVEQTETPEQLEIRRREKGSKDKAVKREICAVVSKGTMTEGESLLMNPDTSYLLSIKESSHAVGVRGTDDLIIGLCLVDVSTGKFIIGQFEDDLERHGLCSILSQFRPVEIIRPSDVLSSETERVLKNNLRSPLVNVLSLAEFWDADKTMNEITKYCSTSSTLVSENGDGDESTNFGSASREMPGLLVELASNGHSYALSALGGCLYYLRQSFLDETLIKCAKFEMLPCLGSHDARQNECMILDATALENLEILENNQNGGPQGTLYAQLDHCVTSFGKRLLKRWLARPLYDTKSIQERQDAVACFKGFGLQSVVEFRKELSRLPDMERLLSRIFSRCMSNGRNNSKVVLYEDASKKQLQEFLVCLRGCDVMVQVLDSLRTILDSTESVLLYHLLTPGKGHPEMSPIIEHFKEAFDWSEADKNGRVIPHEGIDVEYDSACERVKEIESSLTRYLKEQQKILGTKIAYVTVGKDMYLLEVPESLRGAVPRDYELQSSKKGFFRYWTPRIKEDLLELSQAEAEKESALKGIMQRLIGQFSDQHSKLRQLVSVTAELDVLISLAIASDYYEGPTCRPIIKETCLSDNDYPYLLVKGLGHPLLRNDALGKGAFVPNDVKIGGRGCANFILITGPNMGGKSTLIRQVCLAVILAQIGADVPAESFELSLVDRIFVRMGARDHIMSGQSTFLVELSETASILSSATRNSLVALDELGRGTSTSDGQAIAASVFEYLNHKVCCRGLFSTHYHGLAQEYEKDANVYLGHMACQVGKGLDGVEEVTFLYKLTPGSCPRSYGVNVARLAGIPSSVLQNATRKSSDVENSYGKHNCGAKRRIQDSSIHQELALMKDLISVAKSWDGHEDSPVNLGLLCDKQKKAKLLLVRI